MNILSLPKRILPFFAGLLMVQMMFFVLPTQAACNGYDPEDPYGLDCGENSNLTDKDARDVVANLINVVLQISGIILIVYIIYAGYLWMTAGGDDEQIGKAKSIISACVMGLLIVFSAYSLASFVIEKLRTATGT
jgi:hypothetical protein